MSFVSGRMIPLMTFISSVPSSADRNRFMGLLNSIRGFGSAIFAYVTGLVVTTSGSGELIHFDKVGCAAIVISIGALIMFNKLKKITSA